MLDALTIAGGVALILFGVRFLRKGLDRLFGSRLARGAQVLAGNRVKAFLSGLGVSIVAPSSTTISVLAVQTVQSGQMTARQTLALMFGADVGLTVTVALIAMRIEQYAPVLVLAGAIRPGREFPWMWVRATAFYLRAMPARKSRLATKSS